MTLRQQRYETYLESDAWQILRKQKFAIVGRICQNCAKKGPIHVHHIRYKNLNDCTTDDLIVFCEDCHNILHKMLRFKKLDMEGHEIKEACALINEFKASPEYEIRKNRIRLKRQFQQKQMETHINPKRLAKREKKEISRAMQYLFSQGSTMGELQSFISKVQAIADRRNGIPIKIPHDRPHIAALILEFSTTS